MVPYRNNSNHVVDHSDEQVENEEQEVAIVLKSKAVVDPCYSHPLSKFMFTYDSGGP